MSPADDHPVARISTGAVRGRRWAGVQRFAGIPYAAPPTGIRIR